MAGLGQIRLFLLEKYKKEKLGHILEKKCREAHPSKKSMDIPTFQVIQSCHKEIVEYGGSYLNDSFLS